MNEPELQWSPLTQGWKYTGYSCVIVINFFRTLVTFNRTIINANLLIDRSHVVTCPFDILNFDANNLPPRLIILVLELNLAMLGSAV